MLESVVRCLTWAGVAMPVSISVIQFLSNERSTAFLARNNLIHSFTAIEPPLLFVPLLLVLLEVEGEGEENDEDDEQISLSISCKNNY